MKRFLIYLLLLITLPIGAKDLSDYYLMRPRTNDLLFFIFPMELASKNRSIEPAEFDITYITSEADATINMSIFSEVALRTDSIAFLNKDVYFVCRQFETFYIEKAQKKGWEHRYSCKIPFRIISELYRLPSPLELKIYSIEQILTYSPSERIWKSERKCISEIVETIELNLPALTPQK